MKDLDFIIIHKSEFKKNWEEINLLLEEALYDGFHYYDGDRKYVEFNIPGWCQILDLNIKEQGDYLAIGLSSFPEKYKNEFINLLGKDFQDKAITFSYYDELKK